MKIKEILDEAIKDDLKDKTSEEKCYYYLDKYFNKHLKNKLSNTGETEMINVFMNYAMNLSKKYKVDHRTLRGYVNNKIKAELRKRSMGKKQIRKETNLKPGSRARPSDIKSFLNNRDGFTYY